MTKYELIFRIIEITLQLVLVIFAGMALSVWKREVRGKDKYRLAREMLAYIKNLRFEIFEKGGSWHQIFLNDILVDKEKFYSDQLALIGKKKVYFDNSIWGLFDHINVRGDIFLPRQIRCLLADLCPSSAEQIGEDKKQFTYIKLAGMVPTQNKIIGDTFNGIYQINHMEHLAVEEYFRKWECLIVELQKIT